MAVRSAFFATVEDADAQPLTKATVSVTPAGERRAVRCEETAPGQYTTRGLPIGPATVRLAKRGYRIDSY